MPSITVKNIPDGLYESLKLSAREHRRSINGELIVCLERALRPQKFDLDSFRTGAREIRERLPSGGFKLDEIDRARKEGRE